MISTTCWIQIRLSIRWRRVPELWSDAELAACRAVPSENTRHPLEDTTSCHWILRRRDLGPWRAAPPCGTPFRCRQLTLRGGPGGKSTCFTSEPGAPRPSDQALRGQVGGSRQLVQGMSQRSRLLVDPREIHSPVPWEFDPPSDARTRPMWSNIPWGRDVGSSTARRRLWEQRVVLWEVAITTAHRRLPLAPVSRLASRERAPGPCI